MDLTTLTLREFAADLPAPRRAGSVEGSVESRGISIARTTLRRCRTREQGIALMTVSHAIEYLLHSRLIQQKTTTGAESEALAILLNANLSVYNDGAEIVPTMSLTSRLRRWFHGGSPMKQNAVPAQ